MSDNTTCFQIRGIEKEKWAELTNKIKRAVINKQTRKIERRSIENYFRQLIYKISKLDENDLNNMILEEARIEVKIK